MFFYFKKIKQIDSERFFAYVSTTAFFAKFDEFSGATNVDISTSKIWNRFWASENIFKKLFFLDKKKSTLLKCTFFTKDFLLSAFIMTLLFFLFSFRWCILFDVFQDRLSFFYSCSDVCFLFHRMRKT